MNSTRQVVQRALPPQAWRMSTLASCSIASTSRLPFSTSTVPNPSTVSLGMAPIVGQPLTTNPFFARTSRTRSRRSPCSSINPSSTAPPVPQARFSSAHSSLRKAALFGRPSTTVTVLPPRPAGSEGALQSGAQLFEKGGFVRQSFDHRQGLAAPPLLLHPQLRDDPFRDRIARGPLAAALAILVRPAAPRTDAAQAGRVDETPAVAIAHDAIICRVVAVR